MNDVQRIAEERAAQPRTRPIGSSMQSEHRIAKNAVVQQINALDGARIQKIDVVDDRKQTYKKRSVVAYCRVSTDEVEQAVSIAMQVKAYREKINANPDWINKLASLIDVSFACTEEDVDDVIKRLLYIFYKFYKEKARRIPSARSSNHKRENGFICRFNESK